MIFVNIISIYFFVMIVAAVYSSAHIRSLNESGYARAGILLCFAICFYILGYAMELNSVGQPQILFWNRIEYVGIPFVSALWLSVGLMYTGHYMRYKKGLFAVIYSVPFVTLALRLTDDYHHLYFSSVRFVMESGMLRLVKNPGPWMIVQTFHSMLMIVVTLGLFIHDSVKAGEKGKGKIRLIIAASFFAVAGLVLSLAKPFGVHIDYMALCLPAACMMVILAIRRYDFLETKSIARSEVFASSKDAIFLVNQTNKVIDYNRSAKAILDKLQIIAAGEHLTTLFGQTPELLEGFLSHETSIVKLRIDGAERFYEISTKGIDGRRAMHGWIKTVRDVTETYELNENLKRQAMVDELSGLCNRRAFMQLGLELMLESDKTGGTLYLLMMDLDNFKHVNDRYGHQMGDQVIQRFSAILKSAFNADSLIARLGGEEFAVLLPGGTDEAVQDDAYSVLNSMALCNFCCQGKTFHVTTSIGIAKRGDPARTLDGLMHVADQSLYQSKDRGRNCVTVASPALYEYDGLYDSGSEVRQ